MLRKEDAVTRFMTCKTAGLALLAVPAAALATPPQATPANPHQPMIDAAHALALAMTSPAQPQSQAPKTDHDQGDDHASDRAIFVVCNHDNPSARRSAICPAPNSPP